MLTKDVLLIVLILHYSIILIYLMVFLFTGRTYFRREYLFPLLLIPVFGLLIGLGIELVHVFGKHGKKAVDMESMTLGSDIYWRTLQKPNENLNLVPLEEAIKIDEFGVRRRILLDSLFDDPVKHLDVLLIARHNDDAETAHYAATTIENIQRDFQMQLQYYAGLVKAHPNDQTMLDGYIKVLGNYIDSGLLEKYLLKRQRMILSNLLDKKLELDPNDKQTLIKKLKNSLALNEYVPVLGVSERLRKNWPHDEEIWIESLRACVEAKDRHLFQEIVQEIQMAEVDWTNSGKEQINFWLREQPL